MLENYEQFSQEELNILEPYVTNADQSIFVVKNLPEVIKGALFSRYSRSKLGLRSLLLKEFIQNANEAGFEEVAKEAALNQHLAIQKAQSFYDRILDGYGDDSIGELGGAHLAVENVSMLAAKVIQDCRIGGSPLEKSTRYIPFDQKVQGEYLYFKDPTLLASAHKELYIETCNDLFDTYSELIAPLTEIMKERYPQEEGTPTGAYTAALRAQVLDCLRGLLPASTLTNMGLFGNGRFYEGLMHKLHSHTLGELQEIGRVAHQELSKVIPSFVRRSKTDHKTHESFDRYSETLEASLSCAAGKYLEQEALSSTKVAPLTDPEGKEGHPLVRLLHFDPDSVYRVAAGLLYEKSDLPLDVLEKRVKELEPNQLEEIFEAATHCRQMRRHKSPRALEYAAFTFEVLGDFGAFRDMHRHRMLTQQRQLLTCDFGFYVPEEILGTPIETPYRLAMARAKEAYRVIHQELPVEAQYVVPMAYRIRWVFHVNLRSLQWLTELRSTPAGHPCYRYMAQEMARQAGQALPELECFLQFVDYSGHDLGRMEQETRREQKKSSFVSTS